MSGWLGGYTGWLGTYWAWLGGLTNETGGLEQTVTIDAANPVLHIHMGTYSSESTCGNDTAALYIADTLVQSWSLCHTYAWNVFTHFSEYEFDASAWAGQSVTLRIQVTNNDTTPSSVWVDRLWFGPLGTNTSIVAGDFTSSQGWVSTSRSNGLQASQFIAGGVARLGGQNPVRNYASDRISQYVTIPADARSLRFVYITRSNEVCGSYYDVLEVKVNDTSVGLMDLCGGVITGNSAVDISAFAGQRVRVSFAVVSDFLVGSEAVIDNVEISTTPVNAATALRPVVLNNAAPKPGDTIMLNK